MKNNFIELALNIRRQNGEGHRWSQRWRGKDRVVKWWTEEESEDISKDKGEQSRN